MAYIVIHTPGHPPQRVALRETIILGRAVGCEIWLDDSSVSRHHCRFEPRGDDWLIVDLESRNGTFIDNILIKEQMLEEGMTIRIGASEVEFHAERYISHRPADPWESVQYPGNVLARESASENTTIAGETLQFSKLSETLLGDTSDGSKPSLAFTRPPPTPQPAENDPGMDEV